MLNEKFLEGKMWVEVRGGREVFTSTTSSSNQHEFILKAHKDCMKSFLRCFRFRWHSKDKSLNLKKEIFVRKFKREKDVWRKKACEIVRTFDQEKSSRLLVNSKRFHTSQKLVKAKRKLHKQCRSHQFSVSMSLGFYHKATDRDKSQLEKH